MNDLVNSKHIYVEKEKRYLNELLSMDRETGANELLFGKKEIRGKIFSNIEFNDNILDVQFEDCIFENCKFSGGKIRWSSFFECCLKNCSFIDEKVFQVFLKNSALLECKFGYARDYQELLFESCYIYKTIFCNIGDLQLSVKDCLLSENAFTNVSLRGFIKNTFLFSIGCVNAEKIYFNLTESAMDLETIVGFSFSDLFSGLSFFEDGTKSYCSEYRKKLLTDDFVNEWKKKVPLSLHIF